MPTKNPGVRSQPEELLRKERDFAEALVETAQTIVLVLDLQGRILRFNPYMENVSGYALAEVQGKDWFSTFLPARSAEHTKTLFQDAVNGVQTRGNVDAIVTRDRRERLIEWYCKTLRDGDGNAIGLLATGQDITERMRADASIQELNRLLELRVREEAAKNREKDFLLIQQSRLATMGEMLHNVAHQWRQPLNALALLQANIKDAFDYGELTPDSMSRFIEDGRRYIQKMSTTIDDFRSFFQTSEAITHFNLAEAVRDALSIMDATFKDEKIAVAVETPVEVFADGLFNELSHLLLNVLSNARDAIKAQGRTDGLVIIWLEYEDNMGVVRIRDNGGGIPDETLPKIFDPYFTTKPGGTGIGLYLARMVLHHMGGRIKARNTDEGVEIAIFIPAGT